MPNIRTITRNGHDYTIDDTRHGTFDYWSVFANGSWEPRTEEILDRFLTPDTTFLDIGAWCGPITMIAADRCQHVYAVEPDPVAVADLRRNLALSSINNVTVCECAIAERSGHVEIGPVLDGLLGDSMTTVWSHTDKLRVPAVSLYVLLVEQDIKDLALIKLDVEGAEETILPAITSFLEYTHVPLLLSTHAALAPEPTAYLDTIRAALEPFHTEVIDGSLKDLGVLLVTS
jgi:FkbM family methyltransferase